MRSLAPPLALALAALPLGAQETKPALPILIRGANSAATQDPKPAAPATAYEALVREYQAAQNAWMEGYGKAAEAGEADARKYLADQPQPQAEFARRFAAAAKEHAGTDAAVPYLVWLAQNDGQHIEEHMTALLDAHLESPAIAPAVQNLQWATWQIGKDKTLALLERVVEGSPHDAVKLQARYVRANIRMEDRSDEAQAAVKDDLLAVIEHGSAALQKRAKGDLFELEHLQIGMTAPEIEGEDLDGVAMKLSDFRGKVVVLDFWGDW